MPDPMLLNFRLDKDLWRQFYEAHFAADRSLKFRYLWGVACIIIGSFGLGGLLASKLVSGLLLATGFYGVLSRHLLVERSIRRSSRHPFVGKELAVTVSTEELAVRSETTGYSQPWSNFIGYRKVKPGYIFYLDRSSFFFIPAEALSPETDVQLKSILESAGLRKL